MHNRRDFLARTIGGTSLLAVGSVVPEFLANTAIAADKAEKGKDTVLVVIELTGGNDGLNTVAPYGDDLYHKARPTLAFGKKDVLKLDDYCGLHPRMNEMKNLYDNKNLAVIRGVGYPNPDRSHFESMDIWQLGDPKRAETSGWLARTIPSMSIKDAGVPGMFIGQDRLPVALQGADGGVISLADRANFKLQLTGNEKARKKLIEDLNGGKDSDPAKADLASFVRKRQLQTYSSLQKIEEALKQAGPNEQNEGGFRPGRRGDGNDLATLQGKLGLIARLIQKGLGTRIYYVQLSGFDTHAEQSKPHADLMGELSSSIGNFFNGLGGGETADRVALMTYSEFGRRVKENGSRGTDHGSGSCMFVAGHKVAGGLIGKHPSLDDLADGDLRYHTDFRRVYASLLDDWLGVESRAVLGDTFEKLALIDLNKKPTPAGNPDGPNGLPPGAPKGPLAPPAAVKEVKEVKEEIKE
ncbi:MAG TPA: DUF1501 domain-containing protein [Gemmata sp.]|jgi:uncharacterized protein (DUF1501 family)|nr:DUF1501 domain-containing protein [Gemmata sp.]